MTLWMLSSCIGVLASGRPLPLFPGLGGKKSGGGLKPGKLLNALAVVATAVKPATRQNSQGNFCM